jgi:hypothetical protein
MARARPDIDYVEALATIRHNYVEATPRQRLSIIRQRLEDHHFGPNRLVTSVSAVEGFTRCLVTHFRVTSKEGVAVLYKRYRNTGPKRLVQDYLTSMGVADPVTYFGEDTWRLFGYAIDYRNLLVHECTYLGLDKFPSLISACEDILDKLVKLERLRGKRS